MAKSHKLWLAITAVSALTSAALAQNVCTGKADGQIACINPTTFTICAGGAITPTQSTALGTACCQDTITSINDAKCISICSGVPIGNTVCVSSSSISICTSSGPSIAQPCAPGTICCGTKCVFPSDSSCGQPAAPITTTVAAPVATTTVAAPIATTTAAAPVITEVPGNPCAGQPDGKIACLSATTFNICSNQALVNALPQTCPGTTVCCSALNGCVNAGTCPVANPVVPTTIAAPVVTTTTVPAPVTTTQAAAPISPITPTCAGVPDNQITCLSPTTFNICYNGAFALAVPQSCSTGLYCCAPTNTCTRSGECPASPPPPPPSGPTCTGVADNQLRCLSTNTFNICYNQAFSLAVPQTCAANTVCCEAINSCVYPGTCPIPGALPPPNPPTSCAGMPDGKNICLSSSTFNTCLNGGFASVLPQPCATGTVCCTALGVCVMPGTCPIANGISAATSDSSSPPPSVQSSATCAGAVDGRAVCLSSSTFNICVNGAFAQALPQSCAGGTVCCNTLGACVWPGQCPAAPSTPPLNPVIPSPPSVVPIVDRNACLGTANGKIACTATSRFNICENGAFPTAVDQSCATASLVCCAATGDCREATACPVTVNKLCQGVPTNGVVCTSPTAYNICVGSVFLKAIDSTCPVGHECCSLYGGCVPIGSCVPQLPSPPAPGLVDSNLCVGTTGDKTIGCTSTTTFNICENGVFANAPSQSCQAGLICCAPLNKCTTASECPTTNAGLCSGVPDGVISCTSTNTYNICLGELVFGKAVDTTCPSDTECCPLRGGCVPAGMCTTGITISATGDANLASAGGFFDASPCLGTAPNKIACTGRTTFNICNAGGVFDSAPSQTCPGANAGVICCAKTGRCEFEADCPGFSQGLVGNSCSGVAENAVKCTSGSSYNLCVGGVFVKSVDTACPAGSVCCQALNGCVPAGSCPPPPSNLLPTTSSVLSSWSTSSTVTATSSSWSTSSSFVPTTSSTSATVTSSVTSSAAPSSSWASTSTVAKIPVKAFNSNPCWKAPANAMACTGKSTFNLCLANGGFASSTSQTCAGAGTVCCASTGRCEFLDDCDVLDTNPCAGVPNNGVKITGPSTYNYCIDGVFVKSVDNSCPAGYVACSWADGCVPAGYCGPDFTYEPSTGPTSSASVSSTATAPVNPIFTNPPGAPGSCAGVADGQIACLTSNTFNICQNGNLAPALPQSCPAGLVCCPNNRVCNYPGSCTFVGPINPISPPALTCTGQIDGTPVCTSTNTFNFCIGGAILTRFADQSCGLGTVCCAATGRCDFATNCPSIGNNPVVPVVTTTVTTNPGVPTAPPAPPALVASCAGKVDGSTVCTGAFSFNQCIDGSIIRNTPDQPCPGGTVCCVATGRCDFAFSCPAVAPPNPVSPPVTTVPSVPVTTTVPNVPIVPVSCGDRADGSPICTGSNSFNYCVNGRILPFTADQPCPPGTVCCAVSGTCGLAGGCVVATAPPAPVVPTVVPPPPTNLCAGKTDGAVVCVSETSLNFCIAGNVLTTSAQPCPGSTVCCPSLGVCVNRGECPDPVNPPATTVAPPVQTSGPVSAESVPFVPRSCVNIPDNEIVCTGDLTFNYCSAGLVIVDTPDQYCAGGTVCCGVLRKCVRPSECPIPNPCTSKVDGSLICTSENTFNLCSFGSLSRAPDQQCAPGTVCCPSTGTCDRIASCTPLPPSPPPTTTTRPPPPAPSTNAPSPTPIKLGDCTGKIEGETVCVGPLSLGRCSGGRLVDGPSQPCALGTICCPERGICELSANCPSSRPPPTTAPAPIATTTRPPPTTTAVAVPVPTEVPPIVTGNCTGKADLDRVCNSETTFVFCRGGVPIPNQAVNPCPFGTVCCGASNTCITRDACSGFVPPPAPTTGPAPPVPAPGTNVCSGRPNGATMCNGDNTFAVCMKGEVSVTQVCAGNAICCTKTNSCDFRARCDGLDVPYTPPDKCYGVLDGFSICSDNLTQVLTCQANAIANAASCPEGQACCRKTSRCEAVGACPDVCVGKPEGQLACLSSNQFTQCANGLAGPAIITCAGGTVCCEAKNGCTWPRECYP